MGVALALGAILVLLAIPVFRSITNPVVTVADHLSTGTSYDAADVAVADLLGTSRGYDLQLLVPGTYQLSYRRAPAWAIVLGVLTFPLGIAVIMLARETLTLTVSLAAVGTGTRVTVVGRAHKNVAEGVGAGLERRLTTATAAA